MENEHWHVAIAGVLFGSLVFGASFLSKAGLSLYQISLFFSLLGAISLLPFILLKKEYRPNRKMLRYLALYGFIGFLLNFSDFGSVVMGTPVALAVLLICTQPLWTAILGKILLKEAVAKNQMVAIVLVLLGTFVLVNPLNMTAATSIAGIVLALLGGVLLSLWVTIGRYFGKLKYSPVATQFGYSSFRFLFTLVSLPIILIFVQDPAITAVSLDIPAIVWIYVIAYSLIAGTAAHVLYYSGVKKVPASTAGIILLLEPMSAAVLAALFLGQAITLNILAGGALILAANYLVIRKTKT